MVKPLNFTNKKISVHLNVTIKNMHAGCAGLESVFLILTLNYNHNALRFTPVFVPWWFCWFVIAIPFVYHAFALEEKYTSNPVISYTGIYVCEIPWSEHWLYVTSTTGLRTISSVAAVDYDPEKGSVPSSQLALDAPGRHDTKRGDAFTGHEPRYLVQAEACHRLAIHL